jgi:hypothetical protein
MSVSAEGASGSVVLAIADGASAPVSALNEGRFRYNPTASQIEFSQNGSAWSPLGSGAGYWNRTGTTVYPSTVTDDVAIGASAMSGTEQLRVVGGSLFEVPDNDATAFQVLEGTNSYITVNTTDGVEFLLLGSTTVAALQTALLGNKVSVGSGANPSQVAMDLPDNDSSAMRILGGSQGYFRIDTTTGSEEMEFGNSTDNPAYKFVGTGTVELQGIGQKLSLTNAGHIGIGESSSDPSTVANEGALYTKDAGGNTHLFFRTDSSGTVYQITPPSGGSSTSVDSVTVFTCPVGAAVGDAVALSAADTVILADADNASARPAIGIVASKPTPTTCVLRYAGELGGFTGLTPGATYYLSTTPGAIQTPTPTGAGVLSQVIGDARNTTTLVIDIERNALLLAS